MNNNIQEDYCSFEVSKLLKEKGFEIWCYAGYGYDGKNQYTQLRNSDCIAYPKPSHALAIKWIRENFDIEIFITPLYGPRHNLNFNTRRYDAHIRTSERAPTAKGFKTSFKATESALLYTLKNLIS
jgi:hypothetical protein